MGKKQLIVQLPMASAADFDTLIPIEDTLIQTFEQNRYAVVDGHDAGWIDSTFSISDRRMGPGHRPS
jgi:hypothetical protein